MKRCDLRPGRVTAWGAALLVAACVALPMRGVRAESDLAERLENVLASRALEGARVAALVERESDAHVLFARSPDRALTPASNVKILTAMATLDAFGPAHQFETALWSEAAPNADGAIGTLWVEGGGDPAMTSEDWWRLAGELRQAGVRSVSGDIVLDDRVFDGQRWNAHWGKTSSRAYHGPVGGLNANYGAFSVTVRPGQQKGDPVTVTVDPPVAYLSVSNRSVTGSSRVRSGLVVDRSAGLDTELVEVSGTLPAEGPGKTKYLSVLDPVRYAGAVLRLQLEALGIRVAGANRLVGQPAPGAAAPGDVPPHELLRFKGRPIAEIVRLFVKYSNNSIAESLLKALGVHDTREVGSWAAGSAALQRRLVGLGLDGSAISLVDGSGLSYENKVSPRAFVQALRIARRSFRFGPEFVSSLPIAAQDGTLRKRAEGAESGVRAKTGLLNRVTALSGFARLPGDERAVFSILVNGYRGTDEATMAAVDRFVAEIVREPVQPARLDGG